MERRAVITPVGPSIAYVPLTQGRFALIDSCDSEQIKRWNWIATFDHKKIRCSAARRERCARNGTVRQITLQQQLLGPVTDKPILHLNGNSLDNRRSSNLRLSHATRKPAPRNSKASSGLRKGVFSHKEGIWRAAITMDYRRVYLGSFKDPRDANAARVAAEKYLAEQKTRGFLALSELTQKTRMLGLESATLTSSKNRRSPTAQLHSIVSSKKTGSRR